ncbi:MAG: lipoprotein-releasing ABC transporter permease subunit [Rhodobiaceae bacterium]|nr:lipoprotein-releasing ABC transporter permease subunit [Rhodobiaceae bacterium]MCC0013081.1 lipoprotein-releasing ABC transporter permease subunit [Rhodobiaceae bacterium]MCC0019249.1 lipoprotein-releasing ABC transporter permease subunit [Rhodobiaceae bacterium]MCC0062278.1 lipoprotein-releasing ABC transporter permease subunit [Rhodobiaceae bacterium]
MRKPPAGSATMPFGIFERMLAMRYLRARRKEGFISVIAGFSFLGIVLGVATLIIVMAVMNGFRSELLSKILGMNGHLVLQPIDRVLDDYDDLAQRISSVDGVILAMPYVDGQALASTHTQNTGVIVRGLSEKSLKNLKSVATNIRQGTLDGFDSTEGLVIGTRLAQTLGLSLGDKLTLVSPRGTVTPFGTTPRVKTYPVTAIFEIGMSEYDLAFIFMPMGEAQLYFNQEGLASGIEIFVDDPDRIDNYRIGISAAVERQIYLSDWRQRNRSFFSALQVERNVMFLILTLIVLVAALNIVSGLIMLVKDKGRDIAVLRTMGATRGAIMRVFFMTGASIGTLGTFAGFLLGVIVCLNIESIRQFISHLTGTELFASEFYYLSQLPAEMAWTDVAAVVSMALALSFIATLYPAWRAAKLDPVEALRYE